MFCTQFNILVQKEVLKTYLFTLYIPSKYFDEIKEKILIPYYCFFIQKEMDSFRKADVLYVFSSLVML